MTETKAKKKKMFLPYMLYNISTEGNICSQQETGFPQMA